MKDSPVTRRRFLGTTAAALAAPVFVPAASRGQSRTAPSERITLGVIGLGAQGVTDLKNFLGLDDAQVVAVCDVHDRHYRDREWGSKGLVYGREPAKAMVEAHYAERSGKGGFKGCKAYVDFREVCAREDIDAVVVATPDHWHALCTLEALRAGKDVYCEKPLTHLFAEGQAIYREVAKRKAVFQTGSQQRSEIRFRVAVEIILNGLIGKVKSVEVGLPTGFPKALTNHSEPGDPPAGLDYDLWCGPSEKLPYIFARHHRHWRWNLTWGGGQIMDWIGHHNDIAHWGLGMDQSGPEEVEAVGWTAPETPIYNTPVDYEIRCKYAGGIVTSISNKHPMGTKWIGENGWVFVDRGVLNASHREWLPESADRGPIKAYASRDHRRNFFDCIRSRKPCIAPAETAHRSVTPGHLGFVSHALGRPLRWNPEIESVIGDPEAQANLLALPYRAPWKLG